jgi:septum formation protein
MLVLGSTSPYRRALLERLGLPFEVARPEVDETPLPHELPRQSAQRLAADKANAVSKRFREAWVIGSDQTAELDGQALGKPGSFERAADQLAAASGRELRFHTAVCVCRHGEPRRFEFQDMTIVRFRVLDSATIQRYLHTEQPYDCAGSFKSEGLGISLFEAIESLDPTALVGLPLIGLAEVLRAIGYRLP